MTLSKIEKCARLMGFRLAESLTKEKPHFHPCGSLYVWRTDMPELIMPRWFNPLTNKADLVDLMCAVGIDVAWREWSALALTSSSVFAFGVFADHPDKKTALANAVVDVACQIYDRQFGDKE